MSEARSTENVTRSIRGGKVNDAIVYSGGSVYLVRPLTPAADAWIEKNVQDDAQWFGPSLVVEHRYVADLIAGMKADGLEVV